ncbi:transcriptional regulator [Burkholderia ubonensis subsp. mesacidophila]|uniref:Transcriptional regulator n=2 Tax=Burkholderia ubonensis TaxID=101571 RepID=A0A2A4FC01_9BURK|nr:transcriptional regulator [Burkholderia ubonensis subsp. mesacidophila]
MQENPKRNQPLYLQLAHQIESAIRLGTYASGDRLPSLRKCAKEHAVSLSTVLEAYRNLEDARLIESRPKAGHYVAQRSRELPEPEASPPPALSAAVEAATLIETMMYSASAPNLVSFGSGYPSSGLMQSDKTRRAVLRAIQRSGTSLARYPTPPGEDALRKAIARRTLAMGCTLDPREIVLTTGTTESVSLCLMALSKPGDTIAVESPTSFGFLRILDALGLRVLEIPAHPRDGLSVDALALALRTCQVSAVLATPTLSNPMGTCMPLAERERLAQLLANHGVPMIEDVIYSDLVTGDAYSRAVRSFDADGWVLPCGSYSKTIAPGLRVGWLHAGRFAARVRMLKSATSGGNCSLNELALAELLTESSYNRRLRQLHKANSNSVGDARRIIARAFPTGTRMTDPVGGSMLWVELPGKLDSLTLFKACLEEQILIAPGTMFSASDTYRNCIRISLPGPWSAEHRRALERVGEIAGQMLADAQA